MTPTAGRNTGGTCDAAKLRMLDGSMTKLFADARRRQRSASTSPSAAAVPRRSLLLLSVAVLLVIAANVNVCSARTVTNQVRAQQQPVITDSLSNSGEKKPATGTGRMATPAFVNAGTVKGLQVWRIENFNPVLVPANDFGKFFTGDSYIVLNTKESKKKVLSWDVHFWLGLETTQDEAGAAAIHTVHLDDQLRGEPVQHREVQEHESPLFMSYFKNGVRYAAGGVATGFSHVTTNEAGEKRLFQVKGKRDVRVRQVALTVASMNQGDCFLLDTGSKIYVYVGAKAKRVEKLKAISAANQIRDQDHRGRATVEILDEFSSEADRQQFFVELGSGSPADVLDDAQDDEEFERKDKATLHLVSDASGSLKVTQVGTTPLSQDALKAEDCFILDAGTVIFVWVGRQANKAEKDKSMQHAQDFITTKNYPRWTQVQRIVQNAETAPFKQYFTTWRDRGMTATRLIRAANGDDDSEAGDFDDDNGEGAFDEAVLHALVHSGGKALQFMPDDGEGEAQVFRVENFALQPVETEAVGEFYGGDSYVVRYDYANKRGGQGVVIYCWQGRQSSLDERAAAAMLALQMGRDLNAIQVRVVQGSEPRHFLKIFHGALVVRRGGHASGFRNAAAETDDGESGVRLFRVRGTNAYDVRAEQLAASAKSLASDDSFVLLTPDAAYVWHGHGASRFEREAATHVVSRLAADGLEAVECAEGEEPEEFWTELGGRGEYDTEVLDATWSPLLEPRLFHCSIRYNGRLNVEEVHKFEQDDMNVDDIMVLDGGDEVYVWIGEGATAEEVGKSEQMAMMYIRAEPSARTEDTVNIIRVQQGHEPRSFKRLFGNWDDDMWEQNQPSYEQLRNEVLAANELVGHDDE